MNKKERCGFLNVDTKTYDAWEEKRPNLKMVVDRYFENQNFKQTIEEEIIEALKKLPEFKKKKFYHLMMAELAELEQ